MPLTPTPLYCPNCDCQQLKTRKSYTLKGGTVCLPVHFFPLPFLSRKATLCDRGILHASQGTDR
jgi:hypothetical protein